MSNPTLGSDPALPRAPGEPPTEKRRHPRRDLAIRCWITDARHTLYLRVHDISRGGLSVRARVPFSPSHPIEVGIELPDGHRVRVRSEVVWVRSSSSGESGARMGARFVEFVEGEAEFHSFFKEG